MCQEIEQQQFFHSHKTKGGFYMKKFLSFLLSLVMICAISVPAFAADIEPMATTVGTVTVFSSNDGGSSSWNTSGHAFIAFKNTSSSSIRVGGLNVGAGHEITFGTWGNKDGHTGIWYNLESYFANNQGAYGNRVSLSMNVTQSDIDTINNIISNNDTWSLTNNCSSFAVKVWNSISSKTLSAGIPNTPTSLMSSIKSKSGYQTGRSIGNTTPIGYMKNGSFVSVTMSASALAADSAPAIADTTLGNAEFITPINMNPNSCEID